MALTRVGSVLVMIGALSPSHILAQDSPELAAEAREYLEAALDVMEAESINRARIDWTELRSSALATAAGAETPEDTYPAIRESLVALEDGHSFFVPPVESLPEDLRLFLEAQAQPEPSSRRISERIAYVHVPAFSGPDPSAFAEGLLDRLWEVDGAGVCGWIVDLRGNGGGNMWPMLEGLLPVLGRGVPGYFVPPDGSQEPWEVDRRLSGSRTVAQPEPAVAVLHDSVTASSGEAVAVAFRGRLQTKSFGQPTRGLSTSNRTVELEDGARMLLTVSVFADRNGNRYGEVIRPDEFVEPSLPEEEVLHLASEWLLEQPSCSAG